MLGYWMRWKMTSVISGLRNLSETLRRYIDYKLLDQQRNDCVMQIQSMASTVMGKPTCNIYTQFQVNKFCCCFAWWPVCSTKVLYISISKAFLHPRRMEDVISFQLKIKMSLFVFFFFFSCCCICWPKGYPARCNRRNTFFIPRCYLLTTAKIEICYGEDLV